MYKTPCRCLCSLPRNDLQDVQNNLSPLSLFLNQSNYKVWAAPGTPEMLNLKAHFILGFQIFKSV